jgi:dipeptidyl-peptidase-3
VLPPLARLWIRSPLYEQACVEEYAVQIDPKLHREVIDRYSALGLKPYGGFINPDIVPVEKGGVITDYEIRYTDDYLGQMLSYGKNYDIL